MDRFKIARGVKPPAECTLPEYPIYYYGKPVQDRTEEFQLSLSLDRSSKYGLLENVNLILTRIITEVIKKSYEGWQYQKHYLTENSDLNILNVRIIFKSTAQNALSQTPLGPWEQRLALLQNPFEYGP